MLVVIDILKLDIILYSALLIVSSSCCSGTKKGATTLPVEAYIIEKRETLPEINSIQQNSDSIQFITDKNSSQSAKKKPKDSLLRPPPFNHKAWHLLLQENVSPEGKVNYKRLLSHRKSLSDYISSLSLNSPASSWNQQELLAYWINAYNALTIDLILTHYPIKSIKEISKPWELRLWQLGGRWYNLDVIEHQILRKMNEPRIHFAIVCASYSCPQLLNEAYTASELENQLTKATSRFLKDSSKNKIGEYDLKLSKIFKWFSKDFKTQGTLIDYLNRYSEIQISPKATIKYMPYDWSLNE